MDLKEYKQLLADEFLAESEANESTPSQEFTYFAIEMFNDTEEVYDLIPCYFTMQGPRNSKILIDGYAYEESDKSYSFFIVKYDNNDELRTITQTEINNYIKYMSNFVENADSRYIQNNTDISCEGAQIADTFWRRLKQNFVSKLKFYIITNNILSNSIKNINNQKLLDMNVEINVWDIQKFYNSDLNNRQKEPIYINVKKYCNGRGLPAIKAYEGEDNEYTSYLAVIPGELLSSIYDEYGSRLLEGNVRSFLSATGKVNKEIKKTILKEPNYFFTYNNGIATTASCIETEMTDDGLEIIGMKDLQIINGGQTTASLLNAKIHYKEEARLDKIFVAMKLTVINNENNSKMIENISRCANSQNKVSDSDFFSNNPFHIKFEQLCKENPAPSVNGNQYQTFWFYERARGSYKQEQMKLSKSAREKFKLLRPKNQVITKTDLAKYLNSYYQLPHYVSRGAQKNMKEFANKMLKLEDQNNSNINVYFFKKAISLAIMFKTLEAEVSRASWFPQGSGYRANIVTYSIAKLVYCIEKQCDRAEIDVNKIWMKQKLYPELRSILLDLAEETFKFINRDDRILMNVTEWCKKEECWLKYKDVPYILPNYFKETLLNYSNVLVEKRAAKKEEEFNQKVDGKIFVANLGSEYWLKLMNKAKERGICNVIEEGDLRIAIKMDVTKKYPNEVQAKRLLDFRKKCDLEGIDIAKR